jgi:hypothetical protein
MSRLSGGGKGVNVSSGYTLEHIPPFDNQRLLVLLQCTVMHAMQCMMGPALDSSRDPGEF